MSGCAPSCSGDSRPNAKKGRLSNSQIITLLEMSGDEEDFRQCSEDETQSIDNYSENKSNFESKAGSVSAGSDSVSDEHDFLWEDVDNFILHKYNFDPVNSGIKRENFTVMADAEQCDYFFQ